MDVFDSKEMRWASCCGVSFCGCNARLCEVTAFFNKTFPARKKGEGHYLVDRIKNSRVGGGALLGRAIKNVQIVPSGGTIWDLAVVV